MIPVTDPFGIPAPDGHDYFKVLGPPTGLIKTYDYLLTAIRNYRAAMVRAPNPTSRNQARTRAEILEQALGRMRAELTAVGRQGALYATSEIVDRIDRTQVRPDPPKSGKRLKDVILCRPIDTSAPSGSIGIGDMKALDVLAYWRTQEFGYRISSARIIPGYFQPGGARPDPAQFRVHPIFEQMPYARGMPALNLPAGTRIAIERSFLREGVSATAEWRFRRLGQIQKDAVAAMQRAGGASISGLPFGVGGAGRRRGPRRI